MSDETALREAYTAAVEAHKTHRARLRLDPDGIHRCPECDPVPPPAQCPCGHPICDDYRCIAGWIYGPCGHDNCGGVCESHGECKGGCPCQEDE
ncbi:hypothetical protein ABZX65_26745 [Streptomyces sp. NPDC003300]|uniref:hypothetical protein n=1 Tax=unclassified Streptomyces TaxID=2593676 RepID=UPI00339FC550